MCPHTNRNTHKNAPKQTTKLQVLQLQRTQACISFLSSCHLSTVMATTQQATKKMTVSNNYNHLQQKQTIANTQVRIEYKTAPPQAFVTELNKFLRDHQPQDYTSTVRWEEIETDNNEVELQQGTAIGKEYI